MCLFSNSCYKPLCNFRTFRPVTSYFHIARFLQYRWHYTSYGLLSCFTQMMIYLALVSVLYTSFPRPLYLWNGKDAKWLYPESSVNEFEKAGYQHNSVVTNYFLINTVNKYMIMTLEPLFQYINWFKTIFSNYFCEIRNKIHVVDICFSHVTYSSLTSVRTKCQRCTVGDFGPIFKDCKRE